MGYYPRDPAVKGRLAPARNLASSLRRWPLCPRPTLEHLPDVLPAHRVEVLRHFDFAGHEADALLAAALRLRLQDVLHIARPPRHGAIPPPEAAVFVRCLAPVLQVAPFR